MGHQGTGMGQENFLHHVGKGGDGVKQNHVGWGRRPLAALDANHGSPMTTLTCKKWHIYTCQKIYMLK